METHEMMGCEEALRRLAEYLDRELDAPTRAMVDEHLNLCRSCYTRSEFERRLRERIGELGHEAVRPELADRVQTLVRTFTVAGGS